MNKIICDIEFENVEKFEKFLKDNLNYENENIELFLNDLDCQFCNTAGKSYELSSFFTKSKTPKTIDFEIEYIFKNDELVSKKYIF